MRGGGEGADLRELAEKLEGLAERAAEAGSHEELMGLEGAEAAAWFGAWGGLNRSELRFERRLQHPSPDPVNALLSLGYSFVLNELVGALEAAGLEPHVGFLHRIEYGRPSLALDLLEAFRAPVVDRLTLKMVNLRMFEERHFGRSVAGAQAGRVVLLPVEFARYVAYYEEAMTEARAGAEEGMRMVMRREVDRLRTSLSEGTVFEPWREGGDDAVSDLL